MKIPRRIFILSIFSFFITIAIKFNFLVPKDTWNFEPSSKWPSSWIGNIHGSLDVKPIRNISNFMAWLPYVLLAILLVISRTFEPLTNFLKSINIQFHDILNEEKINAGFQILYLPGGILLTVCILTFFLHRMNFADVSNAIKDSAVAIFGAGFVFVLMISTVSQIGDIIISYFKRSSNIKDTGKLLPGHGGIFDRIDSLMLVVILAYILYTLKLFP